MYKRQVVETVLLITNCLTVKIKAGDLIGVLHFVSHCTDDDQVDRRNSIIQNRNM